MALWSIFIITGALAFIKEGSVFELLGNDIHDFNTQYYDKVRIINFYMFSFISRQEFNNVYFKAAKQCQNESLPIVFGKVDRINAKNEHIVKEFKIQTVPHTIFTLLIPQSLILTKVLAQKKA